MTGTAATSPTSGSPPRSSATCRPSTARLPASETHPDFDELATVAVAIRDERPAVDEEFAALLDERAAAGFPRAESDPRAPAPISNLSARLAGVRPRRLLSAAGAAASLLVVVGVSISVLQSSNGGGSASSIPMKIITAPSGGSSVSAAPSAAGGGGASAAGPSLPAKTRELAPAAPGEFVRPSAADRVATGTPRVANRKVAQTADLTLSTDPEKVRTISSSVTEIVARYHGLVISSSITSGKGSPPPGGPEPLPFGSGALGAEFQLRIPANKVNAALDDLSKLGLVVSRQQGTQDITSRFVDAHNRIQDLTEERDQLISQLSQAVSQEAIDAINARLRVVRNEIDHAQGDLGHLQQRVAVVPVHVSVVAKGSGGGGGGGFDLGDAVHDAGRVLTVGAGVLLISLAVVVPLGLIGLGAWLATARARRRRRERALDQPS